MIVHTEVAEHGAISLRKTVKRPVQRSDTKLVSQLLRCLEVVDLYECVVEQLVADASLVELARQPVVTVEVELQSEWAPGRHAQVAQAELLIDEVEVVVQALATGGLQEGLLTLLVVPRLLAGASLHRGQDVDQTGMVPTLAEDILNPGFLSEPALGHELDDNTGLRGKLLSVGSYLVPERLG